MNINEFQCYTTILEIDIMNLWNLSEGLSSIIEIIIIIKIKDTSLININKYTHRNDKNQIIYTKKKKSEGKYR